MVPASVSSRKQTLTTGKLFALDGPRVGAGGRAYAKAGLETEPTAFYAKHEGDTLTLDMLDVIGADFWTGEGITSSAVQSSLSPNIKNIRLRINSPGGDAVEGVAIRSILKAHATEHGAKITAEIHGMAASAATVIAMAADEIHMAPDALFMIHEAWTLAVGEADDLRHTADLLDKMNGNMSALYAAHSGNSVSDVEDMMAEETWMTAAEAVESGFVTSVMSEGKTQAVSPSRVFASLTQFSKTPPGILARYGTEGGVRLAVALNSEPATEQPKVNPDILKLLGLKADASDDQIIKAVGVLAARADDAEKLTKEYQVDAAAARAERDILAVANTTADVAHRIKSLEAKGKKTPAEAKALGEKWAKNSQRGAVAVELFLEDLVEYEGKDPLPMTRASNLDGRDAPDVGGDPTEVTPAMRKLYGPEVSDAQILKTEIAQAQSNRDQESN